MSGADPAFVATLAHGGAAMVWTAVGVTVLALAASGARWLRVAQREHYIADSCSRFAMRWWTSQPANWALAAVALAGVVLSGLWPLVALAPAAVAVVGPLGLSVRGRTSLLVWTRRLRLLAVVWLVLQGVIIAVGAALGAAAPFAAAGLVAVPAVVDVALLLTAPIERHRSQRFVTAAAERLRRVDPTVVAITGSYGKTSTKNHVAQLVAGSRSVVATPASFNNRGGLARAINEHLADGTEVFVAEMGTYGRGEIRELCSWCPPTIAVLTAIGPVHLERFGTEDAIVVAKREITERASVVVVNADDPRLDVLARSLAETPDGPEVVRCSSEDETADVCVRARDGTAAVVIGGEHVCAPVPLQAGVQPGNVACAVAVALRLGVPADAVVRRVPLIPPVANRLTAATAASGVFVIDDTFNSNPAGARAALALLASAGEAAAGATGADAAGADAAGADAAGDAGTAEEAGAAGEGRRVVVTPGMVELGSRQAPENEAFARAASEIATDLVVVGRTNRAALLRGATGRLAVTTVSTRPEAVAWVRATLGPGDAVLYENDLPDQYP